MQTKDIEYMKMAVEKAREGVLEGQTPFGAVFVWNGKVLACVHNKVWKDNDITAHAEITAIREACKALNTVDLSGSTLYTTCEPCPMCFSAMHWAKVSRVVFGCKIKDAKKMGFSELSVSARRLRTLGKSRIKLVGGVLKAECLGVMEFWQQSGGRPY